MSAETRPPWPNEREPEHVELLVEDLFVEDFAIPLTLPKLPASEAASNGRGEPVRPGMKLSLAALAGGIVLVAAVALFVRFR